MIGYNPLVGDSRLFAAYGQDIVDTTTGLGYGLNLDDSTNVEFETFINRVFIQNGVDLPKTYDTLTDKWNRQHVGRSPISEFLKKFKSRLYLGFCSFDPRSAPVNLSSLFVSFPSRVFYSDFYQGGNLTWGVEYGRNGATYAGTNIFEVKNTGGGLYQDFIAANIKVGDPLFFTSGNPQLTGDRPYIVTEIPSNYRLIVDRPFPVTMTFQHFWVGSNWFDIGSDDSDAIKGFGENNDRLLVFKLLSLSTYSGAQLKKVSGAPGTSSNRSIINDRFGNTYYFHGSDPRISGIWKFNGASSVLASRAIDPYIRGMDPDNYENIVAWAEGNELRFFLGDLENNNYGISMANAVATLNVDTGAWDVSPIDSIITASTTWIVDNEEVPFTGASDDQILRMDYGHDFSGTPIPMTLETKVYYPGGTEVMNKFSTVQVIGRATRGIRVFYKLWDTPQDVDKEWTALGELRGDRTELSIPMQHNQGSGIQLKFSETGSEENDTYVEKFTIFYEPDRARFI